ncbi:MAG: GH92 family glycosyl hydrolase [Alistipes sp.]|nr:GH92 family glycosyl hydrolase [Alistipes sp.]
MKHIRLLLLSIWVALPLFAMAQVEDLSIYVDPFIGTMGDGNIVVGPSAPFGMAKPSPDCARNKPSGWKPMPTPVNGFSQIHLSGTGGGPKYGNILIQPFSDSMEGRSHPQLRRSEEASLGYYHSVFEESDISTEITTSKRVSFYRFGYPQKGLKGLAVDCGFFLTGRRSRKVPFEAQDLVGSEIQILSDREVCGYSRVKGGWNNGRAYTVYFHLISDTPFVESKSWSGEKMSAELCQVDSGEGTGALLRFPNKSKEVNIKIGISYISCLKARQNILAEIPHWDFEEARRALVEEWNTILGKILLANDTPLKHKRMFYTAMYHTFLLPVDKSGENPLWNDGEPYYDDFYCLWDTFRSAIPMTMLLLPDKASDMVRALLNIYKNDGYLPDGRSGHCNGNTQSGSNADIVITDAYLKGLKNIDWNLALEAVLKDADVPPGGNQKAEGRGGLVEYNTLGFLPYGIPRSGSRIVEYSRCDHAIHLLAKGLGREDLAERFLRQSSRWKNMWRADAESEGCYGFIMPRHRDGSWPDTVVGLYPERKEFRFTPSTYEGWKYSSNWDCVFYEGNSWIYSLCIPHDVEGLIEACGGAEAFRKRLDTFFEKGYFKITNEPSFFAPCLYHWIGRPDLTGEIIRKTLNDSFGDSRSGLPGNDDSGAMSSWQNFHMMGFYPIAGQDLYILHAPLLRESVLHLEGGNFTIRAEGLSEENRFVQSVTLNGKDYPKSYLRHKDIVGGGELVFKMGAAPSNWGTEPIE